MPKAKKRAIQNLDMGLFNITALKFPNAFWSKNPHAMFGTEFDEYSIPLFFNLYHFTDEPILVGFSGVARASRIEKLSDEELIEKTMQNFKKIFNLEIPKPEAILNTRWSSDPFSYGSYSYVKTGASGKDYEALTEPVSNRLFFAGEATCSKYPATTHGAYLSGIREAKKISTIFKSI